MRKRLKAIEETMEVKREEVILFPEPLEKLTMFKEHLERGSVVENKEWLEQYIQTIEDRISFSEDLATEEDKFWFRSTADGVYLHPGIPKIPSNKDAFEVTLGDLNVHALIAGRTGSGKSVLLNSLLMNLLYEHPPWELDLYLVDMKQVEFSRYVSYVPTWHIEAVAATSDVGYIMTLIKYLAEQMEARQRLFKWVGVQKLKDFREQFGVVLPRKLIVVDEFQQLFETKSTSIRREIEYYLDKITKLGRATGVHLIFASQDMSNTLSGSTLSNFSIRFVLPSDENVSSALIGSSEGSEISVGHVLVSMELNEKEEEKYQTKSKVPILVQVPFIAEDDAELDGKRLTMEEVYQQNSFYALLKMNYELNEEVQYKGKHLKYFNESDLEDADSFANKLRKLAAEKKKLLQSHEERLLEMVTLGESMSYSAVKYNYTPLFIERGRNKNIMILSPNAIDVAYLLKLLALNLNTSDPSNDKPFQHFVLPLDITVTAYFHTEEEIPRAHQMRDLSNVYNFYYKRVQLLKFFEEERGGSFVSFVHQLLPTYGAAGEALLSVLQEDGSFDLDEYEQEERSYLEQLVEKLKVDYEEIQHYWTKKTEEGLPFTRIDFIQQKYPLTVVWVVGIESLDDQELRNFKYAKMFEEATLYNMLFIFTALTDEDAYYELSMYTDYFFISGNNERYYQRLDLPYYYRMHPEAVFDAKHRSHNRNMSFKRLAFEDKKSTLPTFDYDAVLSD